MKLLITAVTLAWVKSGQKHNDFMHLGAEVSVIVIFINSASMNVRTHLKHKYTMNLNSDDTLRTLRFSVSLAHFSWRFLLPRQN